MSLLSRLRRLFRRVPQHVDCGYVREVTVTITADTRGFVEAMRDAERRLARRV